MTDITKIANLRAHGRRLGRAGISQRIHDLVCGYIAKPSYFAGIALAGRMATLVRAATSDAYWTEKANGGARDEAWELAKVEPPHGSDDEHDAVRGRLTLPSALTPETIGEIRRLLVATTQAPDPVLADFNRVYPEAPC